jgi:hypothetical protein
MSHWHDTIVDRPEADGAVYATGWTISGLATLVVILAVWVFAISRRRWNGLVFARRCRAQGDTD